MRNEAIAWPEITGRKLPRTPKIKEKKGESLTLRYFPFSDSLFFLESKKTRHGISWQREKEQRIKEIADTWSNPSDHWLWQGTWRIYSTQPKKREDKGNQNESEEEMKESPSTRQSWCRWNNSHTWPVWFLRLASLPRLLYLAFIRELHYLLSTCAYRSLLFRRKKSTTIIIKCRLFFDAVSAIRAIHRVL